MACVEKYDIVVVGGGVCGTSAAAEAASALREAGGEPQADGGNASPACRPRVALVCAGGECVTVAERGARVTARAVEVGARHAAVAEWAAKHGVCVVAGAATAVDAAAGTITVVGAGANDVRVIEYGKLCVATGAAPRVPTAAYARHACVHYVRDAASVRELASALRGNNGGGNGSGLSVLLVGNGGIAMELAAHLSQVGASAGGVARVVWAVRTAADGGVGGAFFDRDAAAFMAQCLGAASGGQEDMDDVCADGDICSRKRARRAGAPGAGWGGEAGRAVQGADQDAEAHAHAPGEFHHAVGPKWTTMLPGGEGQGSDGGAAPTRARVRFELAYGAELIDLRDAPPGSGSRCVATISTGEAYGVDIVVCATGVAPATQWLPECFERDADGGLLVDDLMRTSVDGVYAAGDACSCARWARLREEGCHWFQWRLWSQAQALGAYCGRVMAGASDEMALGFNFDLFTHVTEFLGLRVVLLGRYNAQGLEDVDAADVVTYVRSTPGEEFARVLLVRGKMQGAVLIGETDLAETYENLIMDSIDLSRYGPAIMLPETHPDGVDLEDFFD